MMPRTVHNNFPERVAHSFCHFRPGTGSNQCSVITRATATRIVTMMIIRKCMG